MALPSTGSISLGLVNDELKFSTTALISLNDAAVRNLAGKASGVISMADLRGKSSVIVKTVSASVNNLIMSSLFTTAEWASDTAKEVVINTGVIVGSTTPATAALRTGTGGAGQITLTNNGSIRGAGGAANSGAGGHAIEVQRTIAITNNGDIRGGGGGGGTGGMGGLGGAGSVTAALREPETGQMQSSNAPAYGVSVIGSSAWSWAGVSVGATQPAAATQITNGIYTYYRGTQFTTQTIMVGTGQFQSFPVYGIYRTSNQVVATVGGAGGAGGNGGRGIGSDSAAASGSAGSAGVAGGSNAGAGGAGGTGGTGGGWGAAGGTGNTGATGAAGNAGSGAAGVGGAAGGAAGRAVLISAGTVTWGALGTLSGAYT